jgi:cellulose synthase/poly-beta-1,6-N-acetylglucosamine synthase-like glycosyltransferase
MTRDAITGVATGVLVLSALVPFYAYFGYPVLLKVIAVFRPEPPSVPPPAVWPMVSVTVPVYNEVAVIRRKLERVLAYDYPHDRMQVLVISDASTDGTDEIVAEFASRGVELVRLERRAGKTAAENAALPHLRGEIIVNSDASIRVPPSAIKHLIEPFGDPSVGVASGRDVSVTSVDEEANQGESGYVDYEMWVRRLETRVAGIIGASGCFYAIRRHLHQQLVPEALSRDFAAPLIAREHGFRSVDALVSVPRQSSLHSEYRRKVRTMTRGLETLFFKRHLLNPWSHGLFAWELISHKLIRWLVPWAGVFSVVALLALAPSAAWARWLLAAAAAVAIGGLAGWLWPAGRRMPRLIAVAAYFTAGNVAALHAWINALRGDLNPIWEPTRRESVPPA